MPYIPSADRLALATKKKGLLVSGEINYLLTRVYIDLTDENLEDSSKQVRRILYDYCQNIGFRYQTANDLLGALTASFLEFARRTSDALKVDRVRELVSTETVIFYKEIVGPYEDSKIIDNGDVYEN